MLWVYKKKITGIIGYDRLPTTYRVYVYTKNHQCDTITSSSDDVYGICKTRFSVKFDFTWQDVTLSSVFDPCVRTDTRCNRVWSYGLKSSQKLYGYRVFETIVFIPHIGDSPRFFTLFYDTQISTRRNLTTLLIFFFFTIRLIHFSRNVANIYTNSVVMWTNINLVERHIRTSYKYNF